MTLIKNEQKRTNMNKNGLSDTTIKSINDMVETHLASLGLIPEKMRPVTSVDFEPVYDVYGTENEAVLEVEARKLFVEFVAKKSGGDSKKKRVYSALDGFIYHNAEYFKPGFSHREGHIITVRHIVTYGINSRDGINREWSRLRRVGTKGLEVIDEWLASLNLRRGMRFK